MPVAPGHQCDIPATARHLHVPLFFTWKRHSRCQTSLTCENSGFFSPQFLVPRERPVAEAHGYRRALPRRRLPAGERASAAPPPSPTHPPYRVPAPAAGVTSRPPSASRPRPPLTCPRRRRRPSQRTPRTGPRRGIRAPPPPRPGPRRRGRAWQPHCVPRPNLHF